MYILGIAILITMTVKKNLGIVTLQAELKCYKISSYFQLICDYLKQILEIIDNLPIISFKHK